jgi:hypothetical protein
MYGSSSGPKSEVERISVVGGKQSCKRVVVASRADHERSLNGCVINDLWETLAVCTARDDRIRKRGFRVCACSIFLHTIPNVWDATVRIPQIR